jgi:hypothetical protein
MLAVGVIGSTVGGAYAPCVVDQHWIRAWAITAGAGTALVGTFLPWLRSGSVDRSSYEMLGSVERLGFAPGGWVEWSVRLWPIVPLLFVIAAISQWNMSLHPVLVWIRRLAPVVPSLYAGGVAVTLQRAPRTGLVSVRYGSTITAVACVVVLLAALWPVTRRGSGASAAS